MKKNEIVLLYFEGCPNWGKTAENLKSALSLAGLPIDFKIADVNDADVSANRRGFPSPTILINGRNIETGEETAEGVSACWMRGQFSVAEIAEGIKKYGRNFER